MKQFLTVWIGLGWLMVGTVAVGQVPTTKTLDSLGTLKPAQQRIALQRLVSGWRFGSFPTDTTYIRLVVDLARAQALIGDVPRSIRQLKHLIAGVNRGHVRSSPGFDGLLKAYYRLMYGQQQRGNLADAQETGRQGVRLVAQYPRSKWSSNLYSLMAYCGSTEGDYEQAASLAERGATIAVAIGEPYGTANGYFELAKALRALEKLPEAHQAIDRAIAAGRGLPDYSLYFTVKASIYQGEKKYVESERWFQQTITLNRLLKDTATLASNYTDLGYFYSTVRRYPLAINTLNRSLGFQSRKAEGVSGGRARALDNLGMVYQKTGRSRQAIQTFQRAIQELIPAYRPQRLRQWPDSGLMRAASNKEFLLPIVQNLADTWLKLGLAQKDRLALTNAVHTYTLADQLVDFMRWEQSGQQSKLFWRQKTHLLYEQAIEASYQLNDPATAYRFIEKSRAVLLTDKLNELGARQKLPPHLAEQEQSLSRNVAALQSELSLTRVGTRNYARIQANLLGEQAKSDAFVRQMEQSNPFYYRYRYDNTIRSLAEVQTWLTHREQSLVSYFVGDSALYVLGVTPGGNRLVRQPIGDYTCGVQKWLSLLNDPAVLNSQFPRFLQTGVDLYQLLLAPLHLPGGRVVVLPDGFFLPFEALCRSHSVQKPDYLVNTYAFSYVYSVNRLLAEPSARATEDSFLGMAPGKFTPTQTGVALPDLPGSAESLERVSAYFFMPTLLRGAEATRAQFRALASTATVVQLFTHADADTLQREPVLYFADSSLHLSDLQTGPAFQTQLLVLSACRTGIGSHQRGEGVFSLARGFAALGVPSIVTTLWSVENGPTYTLTEGFYKWLDNGLPKDVALQRAKKNWLSQASRSGQLPHIWAGLILIGDSEPLRKQRLSMAGLWAGGGIMGIIALFLVVVVGWRRAGKPQRGNGLPRCGSGQAGNRKPSLN